MAVPRFTSRQWFWGLTLLAFLWGYVGTRTMPGPKAGGPSAMQRVEGVLKAPVDAVLTPGSAIATGGERIFSWMVEAATATHRQTRSNEALEIEVRGLQDELNADRGTIRDLRQLVSDQREARTHQISTGDLLSADVTAYGVGLGSGLITINRGSAQHVEQKMPVLSHQYVIGRVVEVGVVSTVRLLTSSRSGVQAMIVHPGDSVPLLSKPCYVEGTGNGQLICKSVDTSAITTRIEKGDLVELLDPDWPEQLHHWVIGEIEEIRPSSENILRYSISIKPRANISNLSQVTVVMLR